MSGRLIIGIAVSAGLLVALWLAVLSRREAEPQLAPVVGGTPKAPSDVRRAIESPSAVRTESVSEQPVPDSEAGAEFEVIVLREGTRRPIPDAEVVACDFDRVGKRIGEEQARRQVVLDSSARAAVRRSLATVVRTDSDGRARVRTIGASMLIEVTAADGLWGRRLITRVPNGPIEIVVASDRTLRVRVVTQSREPRPDVWVGLRQQSGTGIGPTAKTLAPDGIATLEHVQTALSRDGDWRVGFGFPLQSDPHVPIALESLPAEPVELILPETGSLSIAIVDERGRPVDGEAIGLQIAAFDTAEHLHQLPPEGPWSMPRPNADGKARVSHIGLGLFVQITASARDSSSRHRPVVVDLIGPQQPGETIACTIEWRSANAADASYPVIAGRFVKSDGRPWPKAEVLVWPDIFPTPRQPHAGETLAVAADGRFQLTLREDCPPGGRRILHLTCREPTELAGIKGRLDVSRSFPSGMTELGDVVLDHGPLLASGTIVDQDGAPVSGAVVEISQCVRFPGQDLWPKVECSGRDRTSTDGGFAFNAFYGQELPRTELRLQARREGFANGMMGISVGASGLRLVMEQNGKLSGSVRLGAGQRPEDIAVVLRRDGSGIGVPVIQEDGSFEQDGLAPGMLSVAVYLRTGIESDRKASRLEIDDLLITAGETNRDPRIQGLSIRGTSVALAIRVTDRAGVPIERAAVEPVGGRDVLTDSAGLARIYPASLPAVVRVTAFGYRESEIVGVNADRDVALDPGLRILLRTDAKAQGGDPDYQLGFFLHHVDAQGNRGGSVYGRSFPHERKYFDVSGQASLTVPLPGIYEVLPQVFVRRRDNIGSGGVLPVKPPPRITVLEAAEVQTFVIAIPQAVLDAAVRDYDR